MTKNKHFVLAKATKKSGVDGHPNIEQDVYIPISKVLAFERTSYGGTNNFFKAYIDEDFKDKISKTLNLLTLEIFINKDDELLTGQPYQTEKKP